MVRHRRDEQDQEYLVDLAPERVRSRPSSRCSPRPREGDEGGVGGTVGAWVDASAPRAPAATCTRSSAIPGPAAGATRTDEMYALVDGLSAPEAWDGARRRERHALALRLIVARKSRRARFYLESSARCSSSDSAARGAASTNVNRRSHLPPPPTKAVQHGAKVVVCAIPTSSSARRGAPRGTSTPAPGPTSCGRCPPRALRRRAPRRRALRRALRACWAVRQRPDERRGASRALAPAGARLRARRFRRRLHGARRRRKMLPRGRVPRRDIIADGPLDF